MNQKEREEIVRYRKLVREENKKRKANYLALEILHYLEIYNASLTNPYQRTYIRSNDGTIVEIKIAYNYVKEHVDYINDEIIDELNKQPRIRKKLKKTKNDWNIKLLCYNTCSRKKKE